MAACQEKTVSLFGKPKIALVRKMHVFDNDPSWKIATTFDKRAGFFPYQNGIKNSLLKIFHGFCLFTVNVGFINRLVKEWPDNLEIVLLNILSLIITVLLFILVVVAHVQRNRRQEIYDRLASHLETIVDEDEAQIFRNHSYEGLKSSVRGFVLTASSIILFMAMLYFKMCFSFFFNHGSLEKKFPVYFDFFVDEQQYFFHIFLFLIVSSNSAIFVYLGIMLNLVLTIRHNCALFDIVKLRLKKASEIFEQSNDENNKLSKLDEDKAYEKISSAVDLHNEAIELVRLFDEAYTFGWFIVLLVNALAIIPLPASVMLHRHEPFELLRHSMGFIAYPVNFFIMFHEGQLIIDYSSSVFHSCYEFCWYKASKRSQVAISIIMMKSLKPCRLTGANMFDLSMETYFTMLKTALSYVSMIITLVL